MTKKGQNMVNDKIVPLLTSQTAYLLFAFVLVADLILTKSQYCRFGFNEMTNPKQLQPCFLYIFELLSIN